MTSIDCPACGVPTFTEATFCPRCGVPLHHRLADAHDSREDTSIPYTVLDATRSIVGRVLFGGALFTLGGFAGDPQPLLMLLALVSWGSAVPLYLRSRRAQRIGVPGSQRALVDAAVVRELTAMRDETRQELDGIDSNAERIVELEERLEFMERLLAQQRAQL